MSMQNSIDIISEVGGDNFDKIKSLKIKVKVFPNILPISTKNGTKIISEIHSAIDKILYSYKVTGL